MAPVLAAGGGLPGRRIAPTTAFVWLDDSYVTNGSRNVTALQDAAGFRVAGYTYGPFGQVLSMDGALAEVNPFRFSSEFHDDETGLVYYNYRYYSPSLGRWTKRAPIGEAGGLNSYVIVNNSIIDYWDNWGLVLYAFDGTGNYKNILGGYTNVYRLYTLYNAKRHYMRGVGTGGSFDQIHGGITGYGGKARLKAMLRALIQEYKNGNTVIDIIGFSRGAALAREFANMINEGSFFTGNYQHEWNRYGRLFTRRVFQKCPEVRFLGIFDTVASFGMPGNDVNVGYNMKIPDNVYFTAHAVALNEYTPCASFIGKKRKRACLGY